MNGTRKAKMIVGVIVVIFTGNVLQHVNYGFQAERSIIQMREEDQLAEQNKLDEAEKNYNESLNSTYRGTILRISGFPRDIK